MPNITEPNLTLANRNPTNQILPPLNWTEVYRNQI